MTNSVKRESSFRRAVHYLRNVKKIPLSAITAEWNRAQLGKAAKETTINRWLSPSETKNPRFEPWLIGLARGTHSADAP